MVILTFDNGAQYETILGLRETRKSKLAGSLLEQFLAITDCNFEARVEIRLRRGQEVSRVRWQLRTL